MSGDTWTARLSEYLDDELTRGERDALEGHLGECADCRAALQELRQVVARAQALADRPPARDLWPGIAQRIGAAPEGRVLPGPWRRLTLTLPQLAAAGLVVAALGAGGTWMALRGGPAAAAPGAVPALTVGDAPVGGQFAGTTSYDAAVADLERLLAERRSELDTSTVRVIEESLRTIDRAIARAQGALAADPSDPYLKHHLAQAMRRKLDVLRRATDLAAVS